LGLRLLVVKRLIDSTDQFIWKKSNCQVVLSPPAIVCFPSDYDPKENVLRRVDIGTSVNMSVHEMVQNRAI
jgi:hypothetical protein